MSKETYVNVLSTCHVLKPCTWQVWNASEKIPEPFQSRRENTRAIPEPTCLSCAQHLSCACLVSTWQVCTYIYVYVCHVLSTCHVLESFPHVHRIDTRLVHLISILIYILKSPGLFSNEPFKKRPVTGAEYSGFRLPRDSFIWSGFWFISWKVQVSFQMSHLKRDRWRVFRIQIPRDSLIWLTKNLCRWTMYSWTPP